MLAGQDLMILLAIAFFIFGAKKLPEIGLGLGRAMRDFKDGLNGVERNIEAPPEEPELKLPEKPKAEANESSLPKSG